MLLYLRSHSVVKIIKWTSNVALMDQQRVQILLETALNDETFVGGKGYILKILVFFFGIKL
jgi:hypothetical protein